MNKIRLLYVENVIIRKAKQVQQKLTFFLALENIGFDKQVDIFWAGEDKAWRELAAQYHSMLGNGQEYWSASITTSLTEKQSLPGNIEFNIRYSVASNEYFLDNDQHNYHSEADSGIQLLGNQPIQNVAFSNQLLGGQQTITLTAAVGQSFAARKVIIHWTTNDWKTTKETVCECQRTYWNKAQHSNARNPNQYGTQLWTGKIHHSDLFKIKWLYVNLSG